MNHHRREILPSVMQNFMGKNHYFNFVGTRDFIHANFGIPPINSVQW